MKRTYILAAGALAAVAAVAAFWQPAKPVDFAKLVPPGALLVLEAKDLHRLVDDWNGSDRKKGWLASDSYAIFSRSRLFQRLGDLQGEYAQVAGFAPDLPLVQLCAGNQSTLALYDIPKAEFLYITRTAAADTVQKLITQSSTKYEPRESAGQRYWLRTEAQTGKTAAFAAYDDILLLATREDLLASALAALKGETRVSVAEEAWYAKTVKAAAAPGELRLVMNLELLVKAPHFRSYWIQRNVSELRPFLAAISDLDRQADRVDERRLLVRAEAAQVPADAGAAGRMLALVPDDAGFYRASTAPASEELLARLNQKLIAPGPGAAEPSRYAPSAGSPDSTAGSSGDLETRIDEPPLKLNARVNLQPVRDLLAANRLAAELEVGSTFTLPGGVLPGTAAGGGHPRPAALDGGGGARGVPRRSRHPHQGKPAGGQPRCAPGSSNG